MTEREKMISEMLYNPMDKELVEARLNARKLNREFNNSAPEEIEKREKILKKLFGSTGDSIYIEPNFICDYGFNIYVGENFYANFNCLMLDTAEIRIGKNCMIAPNVSLYTATHPIDPTERMSGTEFGKGITIGDNCWLGGNSVILPGVKLGDNVVVGAGAVVTKSFGDNVVLGGNPAKVIKNIEPK
ncbi:MAG: sugar O-acetyltransferase [Eubacteriales bacterium]|nr:sugar O-acetyltransferase [Eubacteriales bacterium]